MIEIFVHIEDYGQISRDFLAHKHVLLYREEAVARQMGTHSCIMKPGIVGHCVTAEVDLRAMRQPILSPEAN